MVARGGVGAWLDLDSFSPQPKSSSPTDRSRLGPAQFGHPIQDAARQARLDHPTASTARAKAIPDDGLVPEEGVLRTGLLMVAETFFHWRRPSVSTLVIA